jgi:hypothetical protein
LLPALAAPAGAAPSDAQRLAERHAPVLQLKQQTDPPCDADGEQYVPSAVEIVLGRPQIVLRAPSSVGEEPAPAPAPTAADLYGRGPAGRSTTPAPPPTRAAPTRDAIALGQGDPPVAYPPVVTQPGVPGRIALQYWFSTTSTSSTTSTRATGG